MFESKTQKDVKALRKRLLSLRSNLGKREKLLDLKEKKLRDLEKQLTKATSKLAKGQATLKKQIARRVDLTSLQNDIIVHQQALKEIKAQKRALVREAKDIEKFYKEYKHHKEEFSKLKNKLSDANLTLKTADKRVEQKHDELDKIESKINELQRRHRGYGYQAQEMQKRRNQLKDGFKEEKKRLDELTKKNEVLQSAVDKKAHSFERELAKKKAKVEDELRTQKKVIEVALKTKKQAVEDELNAKKQMIQSELDKKQEALRSAVENQRSVLEKELAKTKVQWEVQLQKRKRHVEAELSQKIAAVEVEVQQKKVAIQKSLRDARVIASRQYKSFEKEMRLKRGDLENDRRLIRSQKGNIPAKFKELKEKDQKISQRLGLLKKKEDLLSRKEDELAKTEHDLEKTIDDLAKVKNRAEKEILNIRKIAQKEIDQMRGDLPKEMRDLARRKQDIRTAMANFDVKRKDFLAFKKDQGNLSEKFNKIQKAKEALIDLSSMVTSKQRELATNEKEVNAQLKDIQYKQAHLDQEVQNRSKEHIGLIQRKERESLASIKSQMDVLALREKEFIAMKLNWKDKHKELGEKIEQLQTIRDEILNTVQNAKEELSGFDQQWSENASDFAQMEEFVKTKSHQVFQLAERDLDLLKQKEVDLVEEVRAIEVDQKILFKEETSITKKIKKLEKVLGKQQKQEVELKDWDKDIASREKQVNSREKVIARLSLKVNKLQELYEKKMARIKHAKELKLNISRLEKEQSKLVYAVGKLEVRGIVSVVDPLMKRQQLKDLEFDIASRERSLDDKQDYLTRMQGDIEQKDRLLAEKTDKAILAVMAQELVDERDLVTPQSGIDPEIYNMLNRARTALRENDINTAIRYAVEAELLTERLGRKKRTVASYDVMQLKTEIKLASLEM